MSDKHTVDEVYGVRRAVPLNYVARADVDEVFVNSLSRDQHIVVFGSSKQGKTSLRKNSLGDDDYIVVTCSNQMSTLVALHSAILKAAGFKVEQSSTKTVDGTYKITAKASGKAGLPFLGSASVGLEGSGETGKTDSTTTAALELDAGDVNDVILALQAVEFARFIVLEDFHYLPDETQRDFAVALKAFHEHSSFTFIVVGVWLDENRLIQFNGDLTERVLAINADAWSADQLTEVVEAGEKLLNIQFDPAFKSGLVANCFESVSVVQTACHDACEAQGVTATEPARVIVGAGSDPVELIRAVVDKQSARYNNFLDNFAEGFQTTELEMYRWLLLPVLTATTEQLEARLSLAEIRKVIDDHHPLSLDPPFRPGPEVE